MIVTWHRIWHKDLPIEMSAAIGSENGTPIDLI